MSYIELIARLILILLLLWQLEALAVDENPNQVEANDSVTEINENDLNSSVNNQTDDKDGYTFLVSGGHRIPDKMKYTHNMVSIRSREPARYFGDNHFCAGSIIGPKTVLTAAHCVMDKRKVLTRPRRLLIVAGSPNRLKIEKTTIQYPVEKVKAHPNYIRNNSNDIAIIKIRGTFPTDNDFIKIIKMATTTAPYGQNCTTIGWGRLYHLGPLSAATTHVSVMLFTPKQCYEKTPKFKEGMLCAGDNVLYNEDPCRGDSGGPLICNDELTGIVSWTIGCGSKFYPSIYTDVYYHLDWIQQAINASFPRVSSFMYVIFFVGACFLFS